MPGFATASKTKHKSLINQYLKNNPFLNRFGKGTYQIGVEEQRKHWDYRYIGRNDKCTITLDELFTPYPQNEVVKGEILKRHSESHKGLTDTNIFLCGFWGLSYSFDTDDGEWDFTFTTKVGNMDQFHPRAIRQRIITQFDEETYNQWKVAVMGDWDSLMKVKEAWTPPEKVVTSIACSPSAERLCKKMGFQTRGGVVFWFGT